MKKGLLLLFVLSFSGNFLFAQKELSYSVEKFNTVSGLTIRAIYAVDDNTVWFAANRGVWGYSEDAGQTFHIDSIKIDSLYPEFRGIAVLNDSTVLLMGISSPAYILKTTNKGKTWKTVYTDKRKEIFFDSMVFKDKKNGVAIADPIFPNFEYVYTKDGGNTWSKMEFKSALAHPELMLYASSNSNIKWIKNDFWFATGGWDARVFKSTDNGSSFSSTRTPLPRDKQMDGIYSIDFWNKNIGAVGGGNYNLVDTSIIALALTEDGGLSWKKVSLDKAVFGSCVQFLSKRKLMITGKPGTFVYDLKYDVLEELKTENAISMGFHTFRISLSKKVIWLGGTNGEIGRIILK